MLSLVQVRSQKFTMGGCFGGLGAEPLAAGGQMGSGGETPAAGGTEVWGQGP